MKKEFYIALLIFEALLFQSKAYAFMVDVHERITINAIQNNVTNLNNYLVNVGMGNGIREKINGKEIREWIQNGSKQEDEPLVEFRYLNHFYNPLDHTGLGLFNSFYWSEDDGNMWSWKTARGQYLTGLTASTDSDRKRALGFSFRALGQVMHLVQDLASPAHVRNDGHAIPDGFESYTNRPEVIGRLNYTLFPIAIHRTAVSPYAPRQFWDTEQYKYPNPDPLVTASNTVGLSEYTNANFFSGDTINSANLPYPRIISETPVVAKDYFNSFWKTTYPRQYYLKNCCGETNPPYGYLLAAVDYLDYYRGVLGSTIDKKPVLDTNVYDNYAALLIPRAVGYSAGLLNYFFRGSINIKVDPANPDNYILENKSAETMSGTFSLYYDAKSDDPNNIQRYPIKDAIWEFTGDDAIAAGQSKSVTFTEPTDPQERGKYMLVFRGELGNEQDAVVGKSVNALCNDSKWSFVSNYWLPCYFSGDCYINMYYGINTVSCETEENKYIMEYHCMYKNGGIEGGECSECSIINTYKPSCAPTDVNACNYVPYGAKACGTVLYMYSEYTKSCPQR